MLSLLENYLEFLNDQDANKESISWRMIFSCPDVLYRVTVLLFLRVLRVFIMTTFQPGDFSEIQLSKPSRSHSNFGGTFPKIYWKIAKHSLISLAAAAKPLSICSLQHPWLYTANNQLSDRSLKRCLTTGGRVTNMVAGNEKHWPLTSTAEKVQNRDNQYLTETTRHCQLARASVYIFLFNWQLPTANLV